MKNITSKDLVVGGIYYVDDSNVDEHAASLGYGGYVRCTQNRKFVLSTTDCKEFIAWIEGDKVSGEKLKRNGRVVNEWDFEPLEKHTCWGGFSFESDDEFDKKNNERIEGAPFDWAPVQEMLEYAGFDIEGHTLVHKVQGQNRVIVFAEGNDYKVKFVRFPDMFNPELKTTEHSFEYAHELQRLLIENGYESMAMGFGFEDE